MPIRARLTLLGGGLMAAVLVALGAFVYLRLEADLRAAVDAGLHSRAEVFLTDAGGGALAASGNPDDPEDAFAQLISRTGDVLASSAGVGSRSILADATTLAGGAPLFRDITFPTPEEPIPARILIERREDQSILLVGASVEDQQEALGLLLALLVLGGPLAIGLAAGVSWVLAGAALRPVEQLRVEADAVSASEPGRRLHEPRTDDEVARLARSLNRMLGRLDDALTREQTFVRDASHELRTPLANLRAELDLALARPRTADELLAVLRSAREETHRLGGLADDLLVLARGSHMRLPIRREPVNVARLVREALESFSVRAAGLGVTLEVTADGDVSGEVDPVRIRQAVVNIVDNALRHAATGGSVRVSVSADGPWLSIVVEDSGEGFPVSPSGEPPLGLGLAIVQAIAAAHGGSLAIQNLAGGGGRVELRAQRAGAAR